MLTGEAANSDTADANLGDSAEDNSLVSPEQTRQDTVLSAGRASLDETNTASPDSSPNNHNPAESNEPPSEFLPSELASEMVDAPLAGEGGSHAIPATEQLIGK